MAWIHLLVAGALEIAWAVGLKLSEGFSRPLPTVFTIVTIGGSPMIRLRPADDGERALWDFLLRLAKIQPEGWTLIGAQMVVLHAFEHDRPPPRRSLDADVLVNVRLLRDGTEQISRALLSEGLTLAGVSPDGIGHRFSAGDVHVDVLAPEGVGDRANRRTIPPARTISVPGGTQACGVRSSQPWFSTASAGTSRVRHCLPRFS